MFIFFSIAVVGYALGIVGTVFMNKQEQKFKTLLQSKTKPSQTPFYKREAFISFLFSSLIVAIVLTVGTTFYTLVEKWAIVDSLYFSVVTW